MFSKIEVCCGLTCITCPQCKETKPQTPSASFPERGGASSLYISSSVASQLYYITTLRALMKILMICVCRFVS